MIAFKEIDIEIFNLTVNIIQSFARDPKKIEKLVSTSVLEEQKIKFLEKRLETLKCISPNNVATSLYYPY